MRKFQRTTLIATFCLSVLTGVGLARKANFTPYSWLMVLLPCLLFLKQKNLLSLLLVIILGIGLGLWRGSAYMQHVYELRYLTGHKVNIEATATSDSVYSTRSQIEFTATHVRLVNPNEKLL